MANAVGRCARDTAAARVGEGEGRKGMEGGSDGVQWHTQGVSSFTGHDPVVNSHNTCFCRITGYRDDVQLYKLYKLSYRSKVVLIH